MADGELDLEHGDEAAAEKIAERQEAGKKRSRAARGTGTSSKSSSRTSATQKLQQLETELRSRLDRTFDRLAEWRGSRGDAELAQVIEEDKEQMGQGLVSVTRIIPWVRGPLLMFLNLLEPVLAFWRVGRILFSRWVWRREQAAMEAQQQHVGEPFVGPDAG